MSASNIHFEESTHTYTIDGQAWPSVTQILEPLYDFSKIPASVLEEKANLGVLVHQACELLIYDDLEESSLDPLLRGYVEGFKEFLSDTGFDAEESEHPVVSRKFGYVVPGRLDLVGKIHGWRWILDIKTVTTLNRAAARLQTAAYHQAYSENCTEELKLVHKRGALQLIPTGSYKLHKFEGDLDFRAFAALRTLYDWRKLYD